MVSHGHESAVVELLSLASSSTCCIVIADEPTWSAVRVVAIRNTVRDRLQKERKGTRVLAMPHRR